MMHSLTFSFFFFWLFKKKKHLHLCFRWVGVKGETTKFNDKTIKVRQCDSLSSSYLYATSPDMFQGSTALSFEHLCTKVSPPFLCSSSSPFH